MTILHGTWLSHLPDPGLFIWGETWRPLPPSLQGTSIFHHPFTLDVDQLNTHLAAHSLPTDGTPHHETLVLPTRRGTKQQPPYPLGALFSEETYSPRVITMEPWEVVGYLLSPAHTVALLQALPLNPLDDQALGAGALGFLAHLYRWGLDLMARGKFVPGFGAPDNFRFVGMWEILLDNVGDRQKLARFTGTMPPSCHCGPEALGDREGVVLQFLSVICDYQLRQWFDGGGKFPRDSQIQPWIQGLGSQGDRIDTDPKNQKRLTNAWQQWTFALQDDLFSPHKTQSAEHLFRACLILQPPETPVIADDQGAETPESVWQLRYGLQALDDPQVIMDGAQVWQCGEAGMINCDRPVNNPQDLLLKGLGLGSKLYEPIGRSLHQSHPLGCELQAIEVYQFLRETAGQLKNRGLGVILPPGLEPGSREQRLGIQVSATVQPRSNQRLSLKSLLDYDLQVTVGDQPLSAQDFESLLQQRSPIVQVNGQWLMLQPTDVKAAQSIFERQQNPAPLSVEDALKLATGDITSLEKLPVVDFQAQGILKELINNLVNNQPLAPIPPPKAFRGTLRPYQQKGISWLAFLEQWGLGACLADDMGLGKTAQLIGFLLHLQEKNQLHQPSLVVCPTSVLHNWEREITKFAPQLKVQIHHGPQRQKGKAFHAMAQKHQVILTSYALVTRDQQTLKGVTWQNVVLDEAQNIKNVQAKQSQAVRSLPADFRVALTGTPVENRLTELWSILDFLNPQFLGSQRFFQQRFAHPIERFGDRQSLLILRSLVQPFILRRLKTDKTIIADLPEKQEINVFCGLTSAQAQLYQGLVEENLQKIEDSDGIQRHGLILTLLMRLKQLCNHPALLTAKTQKNPPPLTAQESGKLQRLQEMLEEVVSEGDRALIFTQFSQWGKLLKPFLEKQLQREVLFLHGGTPQQQRQTMVDRFQNDPQGPPIFILSLKAGGTGLNLTKANHVFHVDRWWNPAVENQATDRAFRIGQKRNVQVHKFIATGTLEEKINDIIEGKKQLAEQTINAGEDWLTKLDTNQLRDLLLLDRSAVMAEGD